MEERKAVIYCRVSTKEQVEEGNSLATQEKICKEYAAKHNYSVVQSFIELGESAKTADRTELKKLLAFCTAKKENIDALIVYRIDRLSRQMEDYTVIKSKLRKSGVEIKSTAEYFEDNPAGRFMENIIANVAQFDNDVRTERSVNGMKEAIREGRYVWNAPFGYTNSTINNKSNIVQNQYAYIVKEAFELVAENSMPVEQIRKFLAAKLETENIRLPSKTRFPIMLRNELYAGWIGQFGERNKGTFTPIITESLFDKVQRTINGNVKINHMRVVKHPDFPLRRFIYHPNGQKITGAWSKGKRKRYAYYFFRGRNGSYQKKMLESAFMELLNKYRLPSKYYQTLGKCINEEISCINKDSLEKAGLHREQIGNLQQKQDALIQKNLSGIITDAILKNQLETIEREIRNLKELIENPLTPIPSFTSMFQNIREFVEHPAEAWNKASFIDKIELQWVYFPKGIIWDGSACRTPETCSVFKLKELFEGRNSRNVPPSKKLSNNTDASQSPICEENMLRDKDFLNTIHKELLKLQEIVSDGSD